LNLVEQYFLSPGYFLGSVKRQQKAKLNCCMQWCDSLGKKEKGRTQNEESKDEFD